MIGDPLQLRQHRTPQHRGARRLDAEGSLRRLRERGRVRDRRDPGDALRDNSSERERDRLEALLQPAVLEERPYLDAGHILAARADHELDRLEHARAHGPVGQHEQVVPARSHAQVIEIRIEDRLGIGVSQRLDPEAVPELALWPPSGMKPEAQ